MEDPQKFRILGENGQPLSPHIEHALHSLLPKFQRHFPAVRDEVALIEVFEEAGRKIEHRETQSGPIERLHAYTWVTLRNVATSRLRRGDGRLNQRTLASEESETALNAAPAKIGAPEEIERRILLQQVLSTLTREERLVCLWKKAGYSSQEIADHRGGTAAAVDKLLSRVRQKVRNLLGPGGPRREDPGAEGRAERSPLDENRDGE